VFTEHPPLAQLLGWHFRSAGQSFASLQKAPISSSLGQHHGSPLFHSSLTGSEVLGSHLLQHTPCIPFIKAQPPETTGGFEHPPRLQSLGWHSSFDGQSVSVLQKAPTSPSFSQHHASPSSQVPPTRLPVAGLHLSQHALYASHKSTPSAGVGIGAVVLRVEGDRDGHLRGEAQRQSFRCRF
jgi:hypothetical protein